MLAGKGVSGRVRLMFWASLHGAASEQMPPPTRAMTWHGMLYVTVYSMVYSMIYGMVYACLHLRVQAAMACRLLPELWHGMACMLHGMAYIAWYIACYMAWYMCVSTSMCRQRWLAASYRNYGMAWHALWHGRAIGGGPISC